VQCGAVSGDTVPGWIHALNRVSISAANRDDWTGIKDLDPYV
jgi:hypothetical protein